MTPTDGSTPHGKQPPAPRDTLELALAAIHELDTRSRHQVDHGPRDQDLARLRARLDSGCDVHGDSGQVIAAKLDFSGMHAGSDLDVEAAKGVPERHREANRL